MSKNSNLNGFPVKNKMDNSTNYFQKELNKKKKNYNFIENHTAISNIDNDITDEYKESESDLDEENIVKDNFNNLRSSYENIYNQKKEHSIDSKVILPLQQLQDVSSFFIWLMN